MTKIRKLELKLIRFENVYKNLLAPILEAEVRELARATFIFTQLQLKIRPRLRLITKALPVLALIYLASSTAVAYLKPREAEIKINGQPVLVAQENLEAKTEGDEGISQAISTKRSPFEFNKPVDGYLSQGYRSYHRAHDIATAYGAAIHPVGSGVVEYAGFTSDGKGNMVVVDHGDSLKSLYAHMGKIQVGVGNLVSSKTIIGTVGLSGRTTGAHVHLEIHDKGVAVNPDNLLPQATVPEIEAEELPPLTLGPIYR
ncbi:MAG: M23 family metallopeptidase [Patescibacteria group bacterium]